MRETMTTNSLRRRTKDDLATVKDADQLVAGGFIVIDFDKLYKIVGGSDTLTRSRRALTLLCKHKKTHTAFTFRNVQVFLFDPTKERNPLCQDSIPLKIIRCYWPRGNRTGNLRRKDAPGESLGHVWDSRSWTYKSYSLFMTSFSIPSMALSNSASVAFFHTSVFLI
jgi:hypothetical protein